MPDSNQRHFPTVPVGNRTGLQYTGVLAKEEQNPMAETEPPTSATETSAPPAAPRGKDEVALELMKFIAVNTGYGRSSQAGAGFSAKPAARSPEEQTDALLELFERCRRVVSKES
jgi:hypothetical protein